MFEQKTWSDLLSLVNEEDKLIVFITRVNNSQDITKHVVSLANAKGGTIVIGFDNKNYQLPGISFDSKWLKAVIHSECQPEILPKYHEIDRNGKRVLVIEVPEGLAKPYASQNKTYVAQENTKVKELSEDEAKAMDKYSDVDISVREKRGLEFIKQHDAIVNSQYRDINGVSHKTAHNELTDLINKGFIKQEGEGRTTKYIINDGPAPSKKEKKKKPKKKTTIPKTAKRAEPEQKDLADVYISEEKEIKTSTNDDIIEHAPEENAVQEPVPEIKTERPPVEPEPEDIPEVVKDKIEGKSEEIDKEILEIEKKLPETEDVLAKELAKDHDKDYEEKIQNLFGEDLSAIVKRDNPSLSVTEIRKKKADLSFLDTHKKEVSSEKEKVPASTDDLDEIPDFLK